MSKYRFYNRDGRWYIDIPQWYESGGDEEALEMVAGADTWLDFLSEEKNEIFLKISNKEKLKNILSLIDEDEFGATYITYNPNDKANPHQLWLCPVTKWLFNEYPNIIYYEKI